MARRIQRQVQPTRAAREGGGGAARPARRGRRIAEPVVTDFTVQLASLTGAGIPIVRALSILENQTRPGPFRIVLEELGEDVSAGTPLSEAMAKQPGAFDELFSAMVRAGEAGGVLDTILSRLATLRERAAEIRAKITAALIYPQVVAVVATVVVGVVIVFVIPKFEEIFRSFDVELPQTTRILLATSRTGLAYWYLVVGLPVLGYVLHHLLLRRSRGYRRTMHRWLLAVPFLGTIVSKSMIASFARTSGTLIQAGVPHLEALEIVRDTARNELMREEVDEIKRTVREGEGLSAVMGDSEVFDEVVANMVSVGEETGELDRMLLRVADTYEADLDRRIDRFFKKLEPALLIVLAVFVGFIVVALFLPLMKIMTTLGGT